MPAATQVLEVWGELACFTRPEMKVERFSYPFITPSAARGIFDAIFCKPAREGPPKAQFRWQVTRIEILSEIRYIALRRNEVKERAPSAATISRWADGLEEPQPILADADRQLTGSDEEGRTQRQTMALRDVRYRLHARIVPWPGWEDRLPAFEAQFRRRATTGKCLYQPYFGCREFPAYFEYVEPGSAPARPIAWDSEIGVMLYDVFDLSGPNGWTSAPSISVFRPKVRHGVIEVPPYDSPEVLRVDGGGAP